ncbi:MULTISPECIES: hypothetical protein [Flavobacteriaceae]|uniref:Uncharacterized protein n=2 Tax=Flavobacteriaceae TaxID=49546 RepID=A0A4Y8APJ4_9FLAO|nr:MULTISPECIES: hypothetical protein [Flavobacteriaceae]TEW72540.1 hypothetical protein E2488_13905 [Gramella jeungdoensis]GGK54885.1 hypothetical protein GCM10007963_24010 [Lutibacter litoralis]
MRIVLIVVFLFLTSYAKGQELGIVKNGKHSIKLIKNASNYSLLYSDIKSGENNLFLFPKIESFYNIIIDGFNNTKDHLVIVKAINDTIIKLEYKSLKGVKMVKIRQNNLQTNSFGVSTFFSKEDMITLFEQS